MPLTHGGGRHRICWLTRRDAAVALATCALVYLVYLNLHRSPAACPGTEHIKVPQQEQPPPREPSKLVVVARYEEDVSWLDVYGNSSIPHKVRRAAVQLCRWPVWGRRGWA